MRFSKAPLIATLMAVALSLLVILPALAENSVKTDGLEARGGVATERVAVGVFSDALDAQYDWQAFTTTGKDDDAVATLVYDREAQALAGVGSPVLDATFEAGGTAYLFDKIPSAAEPADEHPADPRNTFFGSTLYVSNDPEAYNTVLINTQQVSTAVSGDAVKCVMATVTNEQTNAKLTVPLVNAAGRAGSGDTYGKFQNFFEVVSETPAGGARVDLTCADFADANDKALDATDANIPAPQQIVARSGDTLRIQITGSTYVIGLVVDGEGPTITSVLPEHGTTQASPVLRISFTATDELSGLRHDAEQVLSEGPNYPAGDNDPAVSNLDKDNFESNEPISDPDGRSTDINVWYGSTAAGVEALTFGGASTSDISIGATDKWTVQDVGKKYSFRLPYGTGDLETAREVHWQVEARDRAGNVMRSDSDSADGDAPYSVTIDQQDPELEGNTAETGITYKAGSGDVKGKEVRDRQYLVFNFAPTGGVIGVELDPDSIDISDFYVEGFSILDYIHPTDKPGKDFDGGPFTPGSRVYVKLDRALGSGETPEVQLRQGAVRDLAGNPNEGTSPTKAKDRIGPLLTVTVNGAAQDRPVIMTDDGELDIEVNADEPLQGRPAISFARIVYMKAIPDDPDTTTTDEAVAAFYEIGTPTLGGALSRSADDEMAWSKTYDAGDLGATVAGHYAVIVTAVDSASGYNNPGYTDGWKGTIPPGSSRTPPKVEAGDNLNIDDLDDAGLIFEADEALAKAALSLSPTNVGVTDRTESRFPFLHIEFNGLGASGNDGEDKEYTVGALKDSHSRVTLRSITVNGTDMLSAVSQVQDDEGQFSLALSEQELGDYEVKYEAVDDAGNIEKDTYDFSVVPRAPYEVELLPGWNLVSLPGTPLDRSIDSVMAATSASAVLGYRQGNWESAIRANVEDGTSSWQGSLTSIEGGYGYWIQTDQFESIETLIPEVDPASTLPTVPVSGGWNLLGVIDVRQASAGSSPLEKAEADDYFTSVPWRVAYSFETIQNAWTKLIPKATVPNVNEIVNGKGYWVWSSKPGTLVP